MSLVEPIRRNVFINGRRSSLRLEQPYFEMLDEICRREGVTLGELCSRLEAEPSASRKNLSSLLRVHVLRYFAEAATDDGHREAGHGQGDPVGSVMTEGGASVLDGCPSGRGRKRGRAKPSRDVAPSNT